MQKQFLLEKVFNKQSWIKKKQKKGLARSKIEDKLVKLLMTTVAYQSTFYFIYLQGGRDKSGFFICFFKMTQHSWKPSDFIEVKTGWQRNILRIGLFNKNAASSDDSLDLGPEPLAVLRHGVPGEEHHHPLDLWDQVLGFVVRLCFDT